MKVCVQGLWHLGSVTAACLASIGHDVVGIDEDGTIVAELNRGNAPLFEPGLNELLVAGTRNGRLRFTTSKAEAVADAAVLWVAFDTPVDDDDQADVEYVLRQTEDLLPLLNAEAMVLVSSQMPVGSIGRLETFAREHVTTGNLRFGCSPENLRLGKAIEVFLKPDRIVVGIRSGSARQTLETLLWPITKRIEWMSIESAEMTKHAINAFLATSVTFANEIASICECVGADAKEVERGLKSETRIGPKAYLSPGGPFTGGTLARDIGFLEEIARSSHLVTPLLESVQVSNNEHKNWIRRKLLENFPTLVGVTVAVWGLTYKAGTDTLRRSLAVELCDWLIEKGARVRVHDPVVRALPERWSGRVVNEKHALEAVEEADALVVGTDWPEFRLEAERLFLVAHPKLVIIDANRHLQAVVPSSLKYIAVGTPSVREV
jgi:UDPglucose 6-dehydrogenase